VQILHHTQLHDRDTGFLRGDIDQYFFAHEFKVVKVMGASLWGRVIKALQELGCFKQG
jgi:hypothetical protein